MSKGRIPKTFQVVFLALLLTACSASGQPATRPASRTDQSQLEFSGLAASTSQPTHTSPAPSPTQPSASPPTTPLPNVPTASAPTVVRAANLRAGPGTQYPVVGTILTGEPLHIVATNNDRTWYELDNGRWIFGELVAGPPAALQVEMKIPPTPVPTARFTARPPVLTITATPSPESSAYTGPLGCEGRSGLRYGAICKDGTLSQDTGNNACNLHGGVQAWTVCP